MSAPIRRTSRALPRASSSAWTRTEDRALRELFEAHCTDGEMAKTLGRTRLAIQQRRVMLGLLRRAPFDEPQQVREPRYRNRAEPSTSLLLLRAENDMRTRAAQCALAVGFEPGEPVPEALLRERRGRGRRAAR
jgi:hypothetical protein